MNALAQQVYDLLMSEPEWFDMGDHYTCVLAAIYVVQNGKRPQEDGHLPFHALDGMKLLGTPTPDFFLFWPEEDRKNAKAAAQRLKAACEGVAS